MTPKQEAKRIIPSIPEKMERHLGLNCMSWCKMPDLKRVHLHSGAVGSKRGSEVSEPPQNEVRKSNTLTTRQCINRASRRPARARGGEKVLQAGRISAATDGR
ncbi:predicted protein [Coccidioides posadasii str. Silveira]|uniref:Predicted protein n=2 Tax=Coccidioides posadasii TaxID=199306 RepID=E9D6D2_COCPS|nr:predicted protein [Coccidioides posadasii str. Silveira]KMM68495.1 hypothetical protein CPAG_04822 [Coccidioides posadasii RMSCC 3488]